MITYACDDQEVEKLLARLVRDVTELGAWIHPETRICCQQGELSISAENSVPAKEPLISLTEQTLLPVQEFEFVVRDGELRLATLPTHLSPERRSLLDTMLEIYSLTRKIASHRASSPWLVLAKRANVLEGLVEGRATAPLVKRLHAGCRDGDNDQLVSISFIKTRTLGFKKSPQTSVPVLMPVIDFINHHPAAPGFQTGPDTRGNRGIGVLKATPIASSTECFVRYGLYDALDTYLVYGFVEESAPFVRSVPLDIDLDGIGRIEVHSSIGTRKAAGKLPPHLDAVRQFMPAVRPSGPGQLVVSHLLVPAGPPVFGLRRILEELIGLMRAGLDPIALQSRVVAAEAQIISRNVEFYKKLIRRFGPDSEASCDQAPLATVKRLAEIQLAKLDEYGRVMEKSSG